MLALLGINVSKWVIELVAVLAVIGLIVGGYFYWKHTVVEKAQYEFNQLQLAQIAKDNATFAEQQKEIQAAQQKTIDDLNKQNSDLTEKLKDVDSYLNSPEATKDDRDSSQVLKTTIDKLRKATSH